MIAYLDDRTVLVISGEDVRGFLNGLVTNDVSEAVLTPETPVWAGLLSAQGKYIADMMLFDGGEAGIFIDVHRDRAGELMKKLKMYRLRRAIDIAPSALNVFAGWKEKTLPRPRDPRTPALGHRWLAAGGSVDADTAAWHAWRIGIGVPDTPDFEVDKTMWLETNAAELNGVSFSKGCYVGQENTARMNWRAKVMKRLLPVMMAEPVGSERTIMAGDREAGTLRSFEGARGIAYLRVEYADTLLTLGGHPVSVEWPEWLPREAAEGAA
jgi:folate-binding protein YgfZ